MSSEIQNHLKVFMEMQIRSPLLQHSSYTVLAGAPPQKKSKCVGGIGQTRYFSKKRERGTKRGVSR
jgi:hypothetical protein